MSLEDRRDILLSIMNFLHYIHKLTKPFTSTDYYIQSINKSVLYSLIQLVIIVLSTALISSIIFLYRSFPQIQTSTIEIVQQLKTNFPHDLIISWDGTKLGSNYQYLTVPWPEQYFFSNLALPENLLQYSNSDIKPEDNNVQTSDTLFFVSNQNLFRADTQKSNTWTSQPLNIFLEKNMKFTITYQNVFNFCENFLFFLQEKQFQIKTVVAIIYILIIFFDMSLFYVFETILAVLLFKLYSIKLTLKQIIVLTSHVMIPTVVLKTLAMLLYSNVNIPLEAITFWVLIFFLSMQFKKNLTKE